MVAEYFKKVDEKNEEFVNFWKEVCDIESPTEFKENLDAVGNLFLKRAKAKGLKTEVYKHDVAGNVVCITLNPESDKKPLVISGHIDTVHPVGLFGEPPTKIEGDRIYGPGVCDCKGGAVAGMFAMEVLSECGFTAFPVMLLLQTDEENGSRMSNKATIKYICEKSKDAFGFLNLEPYNKGFACLERRGIVTYLFSCRGVSVHASECDKHGSNAIAEAANKVLDVMKLNGTAEGITYCPSVISGGTVVNVVPDKCEFKVNVRFDTEKHKEEVDKELKKIAEKVYIEGCSTELSVISGRVPMELKEKNRELLKKVNKALESNGSDTLKEAKHKGGSDAADVTAYGIPCIDSLGVRGGRIHSAEEFAIISSLSESAKRIIAVADYFAENED